MDFKNFIKNKKTSGDGKSDDKQRERELRERIKKYDGKSRDDIMSDLLLAVEKGKRDGTLSPADLESFYQRTAPMLNDEQKKRLREIINQIK
ncbi:MAG: hypothetical protein LBQ40_06690 [Clostridiales bacterium]|jgi:hypothetical protein|nr:hypothetical protein [Clostridiales bacterium]